MQVLVLDHNLINEDGFAALASGINRNAALQSLSLAYCGLGPQSAALLANILTPDSVLAVSVMQPSLQFLNLSGNALCGQGLSYLCAGLRRSMSIASINLADIGVTVNDLEAIRTLARSMASNISIAHLDFTRNFIGASFYRVVSDVFKLAEIRER